MRLAFLGLTLLALGCGEKDGGDSAAEDSAAADTRSYAFPSAFGEGSAVSYSGQVLRNLLIDDMKRYLGGLTERIDAGSYYPEPGEVEADLLFYFEFDSDAYGQVDIGMGCDPACAQQVYDEVSSDKDLISKLAGNDPTGQHVDWSTAFVGWPEGGVTSPESLVRHWIAQIDAAAVARVSGDIPLDPSGQPLPAVYLTEDGQDLQQLLEKFLRGAVSFSQGADDYLDDDLEGKGLRSDHVEPEDGAYTELEHAWDEAFGYFGAARTYGAWSDAEIADTPARDVDGDGQVDLLSEVCLGHSTNAAKRDLGAVVATNFTAEAWEGFHGGRRLLNETAGQGLSEAELSELQGYRDQAVGAWEASIAASVVHYLNETLRDMDAIGGEAYSYADHVKHWGELKGFALSLQFNPRSPLGDADFAALHALLGTAPALADASQDAREAYRRALIDARTLIGQAYGFDPANLGDEHGEGGW
ncbi:MAG: DUF4856 domain-containing protein [Alphaproteobacteria bacterium]|nr:DUF4856 domain-containing protein [Alphaproteobacteria bacterium]MCB9794697.1 DUF4856 domain-containing protein [Alphaproteobacteria bacterium]